MITRKPQSLSVCLLLACGMAAMSVHIAKADDANGPTPPPGMVYVPAGDFIMGTDNEDDMSPDKPRFDSDAQPRHTEKTGAYFIDKLPVTNADYKKFCDATNYPTPRIWKDGKYPDGQDNYPATGVDWWEAQAFAAWQGKRLPTEKEWEKAARGTDGRIYPWGNDWDPNKAVTNNSGQALPQMVGQHPDSASPYGAQDMAGNMYEWTSSYYTAYPNAPHQFKEYSQKLIVVRGGSAWTDEHNAQTTFRATAKPESISEVVGFRCVKDAP